MRLSAKEFYFAGLDISEKLDCNFQMFRKSLNFSIQNCSMMKSDLRQLCQIQLQISIKETFSAAAKFQQALSQVNNISVDVLHHSHSDCIL